MTNRSRERPLRELGARRKVATAKRMQVSRFSLRRAAWAARRLQTLVRRKRREVARFDLGRCGWHRAKQDWPLPGRANWLHDRGSLRRFSIKSRPAGPKL